MGMLQAFTTNARPRPGAGRCLVEVRRGTAARIKPGASIRLMPERAAEPRQTANQKVKDWAMVQQVIAGDADVGEHLFARHTRKLHRIAFSLLQNREDAEDAVQNGLCKAYASLSSFQGRSSFSTWLTRIVINAALMIRRSRTAHPEASLDEILDAQPEKLPRGMFEKRRDPEKLCAANETRAIIEKHIRELPPRLQTAFRLSAIDGLSGAESSAALGVPATALKSRILRARRKLAHRLEQSHQVGRIALTLG